SNITICFLVLILHYINCKTFNYGAGLFPFERKFERYEFESAQEIKSIAENSFNRFILTEDGAIYSQGIDNDVGQLGNGIFGVVTAGAEDLFRVVHAQFWLPPPMFIHLAQYNIRETVAAITNNGELYLWGKGAVGLFEKPSEYAVEFKLSNVTSVATSNQKVIFAVSNKTMLYGWGPDIILYQNRTCNSSNLCLLYEFKNMEIVTIMWYESNNLFIEPILFILVNNGSLYILKET
ncbi:hypothetical protein AKO1_009849, partial [Acrasis kona]